MSFKKRNTNLVEPIFGSLYRADIEVTWNGMILSFNKNNSIVAKEGDDTMAAYD